MLTKASSQSNSADATLVNENDGSNSVGGIETKQQIENFGVPKEDVEATHGLLSQVFSGLKKAGLTTAQTVGDWVGIKKGEESLNSLKIWEKNFPAVMQQTNITTLTNHPNYTKAKAGSIKDADKVIADIIKSDKVKEVLAGNENVIIAPVLSVEEKGNNKLPYAYAKAISKEGGNKIASIFQTNKTQHTGSDAIGRMTRTQSLKVG